MSNVHHYKVIYLQSLNLCQLLGRHVQVGSSTPYCDSCPYNTICRLRTLCVGGVAHAANSKKRQWRRDVTTVQVEGTPVNYHV